MLNFIIRVRSTKTVRFQNVMMVFESICSLNGKNNANLDLMVPSTMLKFKPIDAEILKPFLATFYV